MDKKSKVNLKQAALLTPEAAQAVEQYQAWFLKNTQQTISVRRAIPALITLGWQYIDDAQHEASVATIATKKERAAAVAEYKAALAAKDETK